MNKECWTCQYQNIPENSFLGECTYFINKGQKSKDIPPHIVDKGCKYYIKKEGESNLQRDPKRSTHCHRSGRLHPSGWTIQTN